MELTLQSLKLGATKDRKSFVLQLDLWGEIDPDQSTWALASVGRVIFTIRKKGDKSAWPKLLADGAKKPSNMHMWFDKQEEFSEEIEELEEAQEEQKRKDKAKEKLEKKKKKDWHKQLQPEAAEAGTGDAESDTGEKITAIGRMGGGDESAATETADPLPKKKKVVSPQDRARKLIEKETRKKIAAIEEEAKKAKQEADDDAKAKRRKIDADTAAKRKEIEAEADRRKTELKAAAEAPEAPPAIGEETPPATTEQEL